MKPTLVITGGHHNSALALAKVLLTRGYTIIWLGHRYTMSGVRNLSQEYLDITKHNIQFIELNTGKIHKGNPFQWLKTVKAFCQCYVLLKRIKPKMVISFGGYLAVPPALAAKALGIPVISHEQTRVLGLANKVLLPFLKCLYLTWPIAEIASRNNVKVVGLPLEKQIREHVSKQKVLKHLESEHLPVFSHPERPWLLISGGKQGAHFINALVEDCLEDLLRDWNVIHQTGDNTKTDDFHRLQQKRDHLPVELQERYIVVSYTHYFTEVVSVADLIIGRSGAHTVYETLLLKKKMLAIPLPFSYGREQHKNAQVLEDLGLGMVAEQHELNPKKFISYIQSLYKQSVNDKHIAAFIKSSMPLDAADHIADDIDRLLGFSKK